MIALLLPANSDEGPPTERYSTNVISKTTVAASLFFVAHGAVARYSPSFTSVVVNFQTTVCCHALPRWYATTASADQSGGNYSLFTLQVKY
jgi:hypothetical protein